MALTQLREWLLSPYFENSGENGCKKSSHASHLSNVTYPLHRRMLVVSGNDDFCEAAIRNVQAFVDEVSSISVANFTGDTLKGKNRKQVLGSECDIATLDCRDSFKPGDVMAVAGIVKRSGCLILICPALSGWVNNISVSFLSEGFTLTQSRYLERFIKHLRNNDYVAFHTEEKTALPNTTMYRIRQGLTSNVYRGSLFKSEEQERAYSRLYQAHSLNKLNALITAPRGRGKSSLLGIFIESLIRQGKNVLLTSERFDNVKNVLSRIQQHEIGGVRTQQPATANIQTQLSLGDKDETTTLGSVKWVPPDSALLYTTEDEKYDVVIVDEAASIPLPDVYRIMANHKQWVLSTTLLGYEGSGSGFIHKLIPSLPPSAIHLRLSTPLRWFENDPVEVFFNNVCLFEDDESCLTQGQIEAISNGKTTEKYDFFISTFASLEELELQQIMSLLALAHYQTTPDDFMRLMDSPDVLVAKLKLSGYVIAAAIINIEGGDYLRDTAFGISSGKRRPKGHLGAQRLTLLSAEAKVATFNYWRINRIAVNTKVQDKGIGSLLLKKVNKEAKKQSIDAICTSYGTTQKLDSFWTRNGFEIVDYGRKPNKASGETSALALYPHSNRAKKLLSELVALKESFKFDNQLDDVPISVLTIYVEKLVHFTQGTRTLDDVWPILHKIARYAETHPTPSANTQLNKPNNIILYTLWRLIEIINTKCFLRKVLTHSDMNAKQLVSTLNEENLKVSGLKEVTIIIRKALLPAFKK
ncbi:GNAT family N-acetyltransferase [Alteromonas macleodii]|uniref:GNAT family N-acetyltransferase n=1 Tax=Alteromonas macleodii TaxID=28108 RepID=UPI001930BFFA|nr:GNAT family N-acetyltransferase [Alteromonas macleodii]